MDSYTLDMVRTLVQVVAFAIGGTIGLLVAIRSGWFKMNKETLETYKEALNAMDVKIQELEKRIKQLEEKNNELQGELEGKDLVIEELIDAVAESGLCQKAWECHERIIPLKDEHKSFRANRRSSLKRNTVQEEE